MNKYITFTLLMFIATNVYASDYSYENIAKRNSEVSLSKKTIADAKMQGECLVGLKQLNFKKIDKFDPVSEWTSYRSISLLQHYTPCEVLIIMEVAQKKLRE